ncbi:MAG TPA: sulfotransferase [Arenimonas sp.]|nr:sulfotransferase [Arenimonas sp.]
MRDVGLLGIHGAPRSGTTWLGQLFNSHPAVAFRYQPFFSYAFRDRVSEASSDAAIRSFFDDLLHSNDPFVLQTGKERLARDALEFRKEHASWLVYKEVRFHHLLPRLLSALPDARIIGLIRDPRAVLASWLRAPREFDAGWSIDAEWRSARLKNADKPENWYGFDRWRELAWLFLALSRQYPGRFQILRYETLLREPRETMHAALASIGLPFDAQVERFVAASSSTDSDDPYGVFRVRQDSHGWRRILPPGIACSISEELQGTELAQFLADDAIEEAERP